MPIFAPGMPRLALSNGLPVNSVTGPLGPYVKSLFVYLPAPDKGAPTLEWIEKGFNPELINGGESNRRLGWLPQLVLRWAVYPDLDGQGLTIGGANGNLAGYASLMALLDVAPGLLVISPGPSAGGFLVNKVTTNPVGVIGMNGFAAGLEVTFRGGLPYPSKILGAF